MIGPNRVRRIVLILAMIDLACATRRHAFDPTQYTDEDIQRFCQPYGRAVSDRAPGMPERCDIHPDLRAASSWDSAELLSRAVTSGDHRLIGVYGYSLWLPGLLAGVADTCWTEHFGVRAVEGTSDCLVCEEQDRLQARVTQTACEFNLSLLKYLHIDASHECSRLTEPLDPTVWSKGSTPAARPGS